MDHLLQLAPNAKVLADARKLFFARRWNVLEGNGHWVWGEYETRFGDRMQAAVRFEPPMLRCSCKSRQKPCKHSLALVLLFLNRQEAWRVVDEPPEWAKKLILGYPPPPKAETSTDSSQDARQKKRLILMDNGVEELEKWLTDTMRQGLAQLAESSGESLENIAARMVDGKLPGIARKLRLCKTMLDFDNWPQRVLGELGMLFLFVRAWQRKTTLEPAQKRELLQIAGWPVQKAKLITQQGIFDQWLAIGQTFHEEEKLLARRTWFRGEKTGKVALVLDFSYGNQGFESHWIVGVVLKGELVFYPGTAEQRAVFKSHAPSKAPFELQNPDTDLTVVLNEYAEQLAVSPWLRSHPLFLGKVAPVYDKTTTEFILRDADDHTLPMQNNTKSWQLLAISGGHPVRVFGELEDGLFSPLSVIVEGRVIDLK